METTSKRKSGTTDLTVGKPLFQILRFALPLVLGTLFQQLYSFADTVIVGRCLGTDALGAVGTTYSLNFLILGFVQGACVGFGIPVAETFGAKDKGGLRKYLFNGALLCVVLSVVFTLFTTLMAGPLLQLIHTPEELYADAVLYIRIIFLGIPATVLYNYASSVLRAMGDSQHPFYFLLAASVLNIGLDYLLIVSMGMGVDGAAIATVLSQLLSGGLCAFWFFTRTAKQEELTFRGQSSLLSAGHCKRLAYIGFPMGFEYSVSAIGAVIMQDAINLLGSTAVAAQTAGEKIRQMFTLPMESVGMAMATYVGQNYGAGKKKRVRSSYLISLTYSFGIGLLLGVSLVVFGRPFLSLFTRDAAVMDAGMYRLTIMGFSYCISAFMDCTIAAARALGKSIIPMFIVIMGSCVFRVIWVYTVFAYFHTIPSLYLLYMFSWSITAVAEILYFIRIYRQKMALLS